MPEVSDHRPGRVGVLPARSDPLPTGGPSRGASARARASWCPRTRGPGRAAARAGRL